MTKTHYSNDQPQQPGVYFFRESSRHEPQILQVSISAQGSQPGDSGLVCRQYGSRDMWRCLTGKLFTQGYWAGPVEEPV